MDFIGDLKYISLWKSVLSYVKIVEKYFLQLWKIINFKIWQFQKG